MDAKTRAEEAAAKERARQAAGDRAAKQEAEARAGEAKAKAEAAQAEAERKKQEAERRASLEALKSSAASITPAGREALLKERCGGMFGCDADEQNAIIGTAANDAEKKALAALVKRLDVEQDVKRAKRDVQARENFAANLDTALLDRHMNPNGVSAVGPDKTVLSVRGWFCTRQFVYDFANGRDGERARAAGFRRLTCEGVETWSSDL